MKARILKVITTIMAAALVLSLSGCGGTGTSETSSDVSTTLSLIDNSKWQYNEDDDVYYQIGISYCETPADDNYETLAVFVPGTYMEASENGDDTYTCTINETATCGDSGYTASDAPILFPVNTPGYSAQDALTEYTSVKDYTDEGFVYVHAGCRGRDAGAPAGVTDLKAAIRYIRYNSGNIAGSADRIFSFGMSGGGAQSALLGVTGDSDLYDDYLNEIGAVQGVSDAVLGSMCWCPITSLDSADEAYEWNMGTTRSGLSDEEQEISDRLTAAYVTYINGIKLKDQDGNQLTIDESSDGRYQAGTFYDYMIGIVEESINNFLEDTTFPYDSDSSSQGHQAGMGPMDGNMPQGDKGDFDGNGKPGGKGGSDGGTDKNMNAKGDTDSSAADDISRTESSSGVTISGTYDTAQDYIDALNENEKWITYDEKTNTATVLSLAAFAEAVKPASKSLGAFDQLDDGQGENTLFGYGDGNGAHFDAMLADILSDIGSDYADDYEEDLSKEDALGHTVDYRLNMYSPIYYLLDSQDGYQTSNVAKYFRINTGLWQSDTSVTTEAILALALENYGSNVEHSFVWGQEHTMAERSGDSTANFISWVNNCCQ